MEKYLNQIILGDCLDTLKQIYQNSIDCIFSDVPYIISSGGHPLSSGFGGTKRIRKIGDEKISRLHKQGKIFNHNDISETEYLPLLFNVLKEQGHIYLMTNHLHLASIVKEMEKVGFKINNILVMRKNNCVTNQWYMKDIEFTIFARKGSAKPIKNMGIKSCIDVIMPEDKIHDTQKPLDYVKLLINNSSKKGDIILDPFSGSGTTAIACYDLGLDFICIEKDIEYHRLSVERLETHKKQLKLF
jgi:site-specific DNA-methyltransferase (adenine-specific)